MARGGCRHRDRLALVDEGFKFLEISLNTDDALRVIETVADRAGKAMIGAGTVLSVADVARRARRRQHVSGHPRRRTERRRIGAPRIPVIAGAMTPTEAYTAMQAGAVAVKLFPASIGGPAFLSALRDPLPTTPFVPVGGVDLPAARGVLGSRRRGRGHRQSAGERCRVRRAIWMRSANRARAFLEAARRSAGSRSPSRP